MSRAKPCPLCRELGCQDGTCSVCLLQRELRRFTLGFAAAMGVIIAVLLLVA